MEITWMELWDVDYIDLVAPGFIEFDREDDRLVGQFQFRAVDAWMDCRFREVDGESHVEWSWEGRNDNDPACGRGWAGVEDAALVGRLFIHAGDDSAFKAVRHTRPSLRLEPDRAPIDMLVIDAVQEAADD